MSIKQEDPGDTEGVELRKNKARQGVELYEMRYVLVLSTVGAFAALGGLYLYFYHFQ